MEDFKKYALEVLVPSGIMRHILYSEGKYASTLFNTLALVLTLPEKRVSRNYNEWYS